MENRMISLERNTNETQIDLTLDLDGSGRYEIDTGCGFLNHMLELFARHGRFDLVLTPATGTWRWITTTPPRMWASRWGRRLPGRWAICAASSATAVSTCPWMKR